MEIIMPIITLSILGGVFGLILNYASTVFHVEVDPKVSEVRSVLPGVNCGACGYPGCDGLAAAIAAGEAPTNACPVGGAKVAEKVADIMGVAGAGFDKKVACVLCQGDCDKARDKYIYTGIEDCRTMALYYEGNKSCNYGCLGGGSCVSVCEFDAIHVVNGVAVVDKEKCTACGKCVDICPKGIIEMVSYNQKTIIKCKSHDKGKVVKANCDIGCIGCRICVKNCPEQTITFDNNLARIDYTNCTDCGTCVSKCPQKTIYAEYEVETKEKAV